MTAACSGRWPATERDATIDYDGKDEHGRDLWRAHCECGWSCSGWLTGPDGWKALDRHRMDVAAVRELTRER
jgi:hypothetical protein